MIFFTRKYSITKMPEEAIKILPNKGVKSQSKFISFIIVHESILEGFRYS